MCRPSLSLTRPTRRPLFLVLVALSSLWAATALAWTQTEFMIGTHWDPCNTCKLDDFPCDVPAFRASDSLSYQFVRNAYFNILMGWGSYSLDVDNYLDAYAVLDIAAGAGLKFFAIDGLFTEAPYKTFKADSVISHYRDELSNYPAMRDAFYGYVLADEPDTTQFHDLRLWTFYFKVHDPGRPTYYILTPYYAGVPGGFPARSDWEDYVDGAINPSNQNLSPELVAFDYYPFLSDSVRTTYFYCLDVIRDKAGGRPFWAYPMSTENYDYVDPSEEQLRFMAMCPVAYGAKGLVYFTYRKNPIYPDWRAILNDCPSDSVDQPKYDAVREINHYITDLAGPMVMSSTSLGAFHKSEEPTGEWMDPDWLIGENTPIVADLSDSASMVGVFQDDADTTVHYLLVVNKDVEDTSAETVTVSLKGYYVDRVEAATSMEGYDGDTTLEDANTSYDWQENLTSFAIDLYGGEGRLVRLASPVPVVRDLDVVFTDSDGVGLSWTAPGDETWSPDAYDLRYSTSEITDSTFSSASQFSTGTPAAPGSAESIEVTPLTEDTNYWFAIKSRDSASQVWSPISNVVTAKTKKGGPGGTGYSRMPMPTAFALEQNAPNPFRASTKFKFALPRAAHVVLEVFDTQGRRVARVVDRRFGVGYHVIEWDRMGPDGARVGPGLYAYRIRAGEFTDEKKLIILSQ